MRFLLVLLLAALAGCSQGPSGPQATTVAPPVDGGGFASCHSQAAAQVAVPFRASAVNDSGGRGPGIYRLDHDTFLWVWAHYNDTQRQDRITRLNSVDVYREPSADAPLVVCTRVDVAAPTLVDGVRRSYSVAATFQAKSGLPNGSVQVIVNWVAGCPCPTPPMGKMTATFDD